MLYKGSKTGVVYQFVSLLGWIGILFVSLENYSRVCNGGIIVLFLNNWAKPLSFFSISLGCIFLFKILEKFLKIFVDDKENISKLEKLVAMFLSFLKACVFFGMVSILCLLMPVRSVNNSVISTSKFAMFFVNFDVQIYSWITFFTNKKGAKDKDDVIHSFYLSV